MAASERRYKKTGIPVNIKKPAELLKEDCVKARGNHGRISAVRLKQFINLLGYISYLSKLMQMKQECYAYHMAGGLKAHRRLMNT